MYATPKLVIVHKMLLNFLCRMNIIRVWTQDRGRPENLVREARNNSPVWFKAVALCRSFDPGNGRRCKRLCLYQKGEIAMKYIELILDSLSSKAALQTALEDACVARWGFCLDSQC